MKTTLLLLYLFVFSTFTSVPDNWKLARLQDKVSVKLPSLPALEKGEGIQGYQVFNGRAAFVATVAGLMVPADQKITSYDARVILMGAEHGAVQNAGGELISASEFKIGEISGRELTFKTTDTASGATMLHHLRIFILGRELYSFHCWYPAEGEEAAVHDKESFFNSIQIEK